MKKSQVEHSRGALLPEPKYVLYVGIHAACDRKLAHCESKGVIHPFFSSLTSGWHTLGYLALDSVF